MDTIYRLIGKDVLTEHAVRRVTSLQETPLTACDGIFDVLPRVYTGVHRSTLEFTDFHRWGVLLVNSNIQDMFRASGSGGQWRTPHPQIVL